MRAVQYKRIGGVNVQLMDRRTKDFEGMKGTLPAGLRGRAGVKGGQGKQGGADLIRAGEMRQGQFILFVPYCELKGIAGRAKQSGPQQAHVGSRAGAGTKVGRLEVIQLSSQQEILGAGDDGGAGRGIGSRGQFVGDVGSDKDEELLVRDLNLDLVEEVRQTWQFYRDRRPDAYGDLVRP